MLKKSSLSPMVTGLMKSFLYSIDTNQKCAFTNQKCVSVVASLFEEYGEHTYGMESVDETIPYLIRIGHKYSVDIILMLILHNISEPDQLRIKLIYEADIIHPTLIEKLNPKVKTHLICQLISISEAFKRFPLVLFSFDEEDVVKILRSCIACSESANFLSSESHKYWRLYVNKH